MSIALVRIEGRYQHCFVIMSVSTACEDRVLAFTGEKQHVIVSRWEDGKIERLRWH